MLDLSIEALPQFYEYLEEFEFRSGAFLKSYAEQIVATFQKQLQGRYKSMNSEEAMLIASNLQCVNIGTKEVPAKDEGKIRKPTTQQEAYYSAVILQSFEKTGKSFNKKETVLKVIPNRRGIEKSPKIIFILDRYGPWHMDQLPYLPKDSEATILYVKTDPLQVQAVKKKNQRNRPMVMAEMNKIKVRPTPNKIILDNLKGYEDYEYWILRNELGIDARKMPVWRAALDYIEKEGYIKTYYKDPRLHQTLFDPNFKGFKNLSKGYKIIGEDQANELINFQEKVRGS